MGTTGKPPGSLERTDDPVGYRLDGEQRHGFPDDPDLSRGQRLRIAGWARALTPDELTQAQKGLLEAAPPPPSPTQERATHLSGFEASPYWAILNEDQHQLVRDPSSHPDLSEVDYPLGVAQLAKLVDATPDKIRYWHNSGLLPARRSSGRHREFYAAAAVRAFYLNDLGRAGITVLRDLMHGNGGPLLIGISSALHDRASDADRQAQDLMQRTAADLEQVGAKLIAAE